VYLTVKQLLIFVICLWSLIGSAVDNSCASEAKAVTDLKFTGAYEKSLMVIQLQERSNIRQLARRISSKKQVSDEDLELLKKALASAADSRSELSSYTKRVRSDYFTAMYQRCAGRPQAMDDSVSVSLRPDLSYVAPKRIHSQKRRAANFSQMKVRLKRTASAK
jgi:hypothetical protein